MMMTNKARAQPGGYKLGCRWWTCLRLALAIGRLELDRLLLLHIERLARHDNAVLRVTVPFDVTALLRGR